MNNLIMKIKLILFFLIINKIVLCQSQTNEITFGNLGERYEQLKLSRDTLSFSINKYDFKAFMFDFGEFDLIEVDHGGYAGEEVKLNKGFFNGIILRKNEYFLFIKYGMFINGKLNIDFIKSMALYNFSTKTIEHIFYFNMGYLIGYSKLNIEKDEVTEEFFLRESSLPLFIGNINVIDFLNFSKDEDKGKTSLERGYSSNMFTRKNTKKYYFVMNITM